MSRYLINRNNNDKKKKLNKGKKIYNCKKYLQNKIIGETCSNLKSHTLQIKQIRKYNYILITNCV